MGRFCASQRKGCRIRFQFGASSCDVVGLFAWLVAGVCPPLDSIVVVVVVLAMSLLFVVCVVVLASIAVPVAPVLQLSLPLLLLSLLRPLSLSVSRSILCSSECILSSIAFTFARLAR